MERLFSPCTRMHDILESHGRGIRTLLLELHLDVSTEEFLSADKAFTYTNMYAMFENVDTVLWLTPHACVAHAAWRGVHYCDHLEKPYRFGFDADGNDIEALARSPEHLVEICDVVLRLLTASVVHSVFLRKKGSHDGALIHALSLAYLMEHCQSLKLLVLKDLEMDENQIRVLGDYSRPDLEIVLICCQLTSDGTSALVEVLGRNQGPTKLNHCGMDYSVLADGLRGNSRLKLISVDFEIAKPQVIAIAGALRENEGLIRLNLSFWSMSDETWVALCDSLKAHPTLQVLYLRQGSDRSLEYPTVYRYTDTRTPTVIKSRIQALVDMLKVNKSIHTLRLADHYSEHELFRESVIPYLAMNKHRSHVRAIQQTRPITYRAKVLRRALLSARTDVNGFWMLLSGNAEVASYLSTTAMAMLVTNLPTPATAAATVNT
jgi:hypothetical protein